MCADEHPGLVLLEERRRKAPIHVDNARLPAGSSMFFYCRACGCEVAVLPEDYIDPPPKFCTDCQRLMNESVIDSTYSFEGWQRARTKSEEAMT